ncbi:MAG: hypothetical protein WA188_22050 [Terriglobales bacterium]
MTSWIEDSAEQVKRQHDTTQKEREWQLHASRVIRSRSGEVVEELEKVVRADVDRWNAEFKSDPSKQVGDVSKILNGFRVRRTYYPAFTLEVCFDPESNTIRYQSAERRSMDSDPQQRRGVFRLSLSADGNIYLIHSDQPLSFEEASKLLLESRLNVPLHT